MGGTSRQYKTFKKNAIYDYCTINGIKCVVQAGISGIYYCDADFCRAIGTNVMGENDQKHLRGSGHYGDNIPVICRSSRGIEHVRPSAKRWMVNGRRMFEVAALSGNPDDLIAAKEMVKVGKALHKKWQKMQPPKHKETLEMAPANETPAEAAERVRLEYDMRKQVVKAIPNQQQSVPSLVATDVPVTLFGRIVTGFRRMFSRGV